MTLPTAKPASLSEHLLRYRERASLLGFAGQIAFAAIPAIQAALPVARAMAPSDQAQTTQNCVCRPASRRHRRDQIESASSRLFILRGHGYWFASPSQTVGPS
jgi:hypothetical protein